MHQGARLRKLIEESKIPISEIAEKSGTVRQSIHNYFKYQDLPETKIIGILEVLKISYTEFLKDVERENKEIVKLKEEVMELLRENRSLRLQLSEVKISKKMQLSHAAEDDVDYSKLK